MNRKNIILLAIALALGVLVFLDNYQGFETEPDADTAAPVAEEEGFSERLHSLQRVLNAEGDIQSAYQALALSYATNMAELATFYEGDDAQPRRVAGEAVRQLLEPLRGVSVRHLTFGEPRGRGRGVFTVSVTVELEALTHQGAIESVMVLGQPRRGLVWEEFDLQADPEQKKIQIDGRLLAVVVQSAE